MTEKQIMSESLYCLAMRLTDAGAKGVDALIKRLCTAMDIDYPPQLTERT